VTYINKELYVQDIIRDIVQDNIAKFDYKGVGHVALELSQNYRLKFPFVKTPGFEEEKEWRVIVCSQIGNYNFPGSEKFHFLRLNIEYQMIN
jgi:hypothetical protein